MKRTGIDMIIHAYIRRVGCILVPLLLLIPASPLLRHADARSKQTDVTVPENIYISLEESIVKKNVLEGHRGPVRATAVSPDGKILATAGNDRTVMLWDITTGERLSVLKGHKSIIYSVAFSPDGKLLASGSHDRMINIWDVETGKILHRLKGHSSVIYSVAFSPDGKLLASGSHDRMVFIWDVNEGKKIHIIKGHDSVVYSVSFSPGIPLLASAGLDRKILLWSTSSWEQAGVIEGHRDGINIIAFSPDGTVLASAGEEKDIFVWDVRSRKKIAQFKGHTSIVYALTFGPGGVMLLSGGKDRDVLQWNVNEQLLVRKLGGHESIIYSAAIAPGGQGIFTAGHDGKIGVWDMAEFSFFRKKSSESENQFAARVKDLSVPFSAPVMLGSYDKRRGGFETTISGSPTFIKVPREKLRMIKKQKGKISVQGALRYVDKERAELVDAVLVGGVTGDMLAFGVQTGAPPPIVAKVAEPEKALVEEKGKITSKSVETVETGAPDLSYIVAFSDTNNDSIIQGGETVALNVTVRNKGKGTANKVRINISGEDSVLNAIGRGKVIGDVAPGEEKKTEFSGTVPYDVEEKNVTMEVSIKEGKGYSPREIKAFTIAMKPAEMERTTTVLSNVEDVNVIPTPPKGYVCKDCYAVVIGISKYRSVPEVKYASKDAETVKKYLETVGGLPSQNIKFISDDMATKADIESSIEEWLPKRVKPSSKVFVYYSGHGTPDPMTNESFIVPYEGEPGSIKKLYPLKKMYSSLNKLPAEKMVVMLDSCFSGSGERSIFPEGARPVSLAIENPILAGEKMIVLAASQGDEISSDYDEAGHGLFTYYLLKGMKGDADIDGNGKVEIAELYLFVKDRVSETALNKLDREQNPVILPGYEQVKDRKLSVARVK